MTAKQAWKEYYRHLRVTRRELGKAVEDLLIYGTGAVQVGPGDPKHVPFDAIALARSDLASFRLAPVPQILRAVYGRGRECDF